MTTLQAQVTLPLMTEAESEFIRAEIKACHPEVTLSFSMEIGATSPRAVIRRADGQPSTDEERVGFVILRQKLEQSLASLVTAAKEAREAHRTPVSPFRQ